MFKKYRLTQATAVVAGALAFSTLTSISAHAAATPLSLGKASNFAVVVGGGITNTGQSTINGDLALSPVISYIDTGLLTLNGKYHFGDQAAVAAQASSVAIYNASTMETPSVNVAPELGGQTLISGIYSNLVGLSVNGTINLDAQNNPNALFILQTPAGLTTGANSHVNLINGAQACNVFWQIGSTSTLGATSDFKGNLLGRGNLVSNAGSTIAGRVLVNQGSVALNSTTITVPGCKVVPPAPVITNLGKGSGSYNITNGTANFNFDINATAQSNGTFVNAGGRISWNIANGWKFDGVATGYTFVNGVSTMTGNGALYYYLPANAGGNLKKSKHGNDNDNDGDDHHGTKGTATLGNGFSAGGKTSNNSDNNSKNNSNNGGRWVIAASGNVNFTVQYTRVINPNGTAGRVNNFAIGFTGTPVAGVPALPQLGQMAQVK